jgi:hypothetical protein
MSDLSNPAGPLANIETKRPEEKIIAAPDSARELFASPEKESRFGMGNSENENEIAEIKTLLSDAQTFGAAANNNFFNQQHLARQKEIEKILAEDLQDIYAKLDPAMRLKFKKNGEDTAMRINNLFDKAKFKAKEIIALIKQWLFIIPGINRFFLEQEVKIKTDKIIKLWHEKQD